MTRYALVLIAAAVVLSTACETEPPPRVSFVEDVLTGATFVFEAGGDSSKPRIEFADGLTSLNDRCPVRKVKLNLRLPPVYVNRHPVGFC